MHKPKKTGIGHNKQFGKIYIPLCYIKTIIKSQNFPFLFFKHYLIYMDKFSIIQRKNLRY